jgi:NAD dependent epimerase/dehydratase family enzyme
VNAVAPEPVRNSDYTRTLAGVLRRPALLPVPAFGPRLLLGAEGAREVAQASQYVRPERLIRAGHYFRQPELDQALRHLFGREQRDQREPREQTAPAPIQIADSPE